MHIAIIRQYFDQRHGGAERYAVSLAQGFAERGHRVTIVTSRTGEDDMTGLEIVPVSRCRWAGPAKHAAFAMLAGRAARQVGADQVIALARAHPADMLRLGDPLHRAWLRIRNDDSAKARRAALNPRHAALLRLEEKLLTPGVIGEFVANSSMIKRQVVHGFGVDPKRVHVLQNPVDERRFNPEAGEAGAALRAELGIRPEEMVVLFSGLNYWHKGLMQAARTFAALARGAPELRDKLRFLIVGRGDASGIDGLMAAAGCAGRVITLPVSDAIESVYGAANVFLLPTLYDTSAKAVSEALACGTPVVTTALNGAAELIRDGANGFVLGNRDDTDAWAAATTHLLATERIQRSRAYVAMIRKVPTWSDHIGQWENLLERRVAARLAKRVSVRLPASLPMRRDVGPQGEVSFLNTDTTAQAILRRVDIDLDKEAFKPAADKIFKSHRGNIVARYRVERAGAAKSELFAPSVPANAYLKVVHDVADAGPREFEICLLCKARGISAMQPLAAGSNGWHSYVLTAEAPGIPLDTFIHDYCQGSGQRQRMVRASLIEALASLTARMHGAGINHRDFYANHIRVSLDLDGSLVITLIDLQRAQVRDSVPLRWIVKDLGQLAFSLSRDMVSTTDQLRFLRIYCWELGLSLPRHKLLGMITKRVKFIATRHNKVLERRKISDAALARKQADHELVPATRADLDF